GVEGDHLLREPAVLGGVHDPDRLDRELGELLGARGHRHGVEAERAQTPLTVRPESDVLRRGAREPARANICCRETAYLTGRPGTARAARAVSMRSACGIPLEPKPPPTCGLMMRICSGPSPRIGAIMSRAGCAPCVDSHRVSSSSSHRATVV